MLRKQHSQHDEVVQKYGAWRMLSCNAAVLVVFALSNDYYRASAAVSKLVYDASVSCCRTRGKLVLYWLSVGSFAPQAFVS